MSSSPEHDRNVIVLSPEAWDELQRIINDPSPPNENLVRAAQRYREEVAAGRIKSSPPA